MKVLLVNGSPHENGCTYTALSEIQAALKQEDIESDLFWIGNRPISGCIACGFCKKAGKCIFNDKVMEFLNLAIAYDGFIFGSPVHYAGIAGNMGSFMDRVFFADFCSKKNTFYLKPSAAIVSARRSGTTAALEQMNKYFLHAQMPLIPSHYWNMVHGNTPEEVRHDLEGMQIMRVLARNMAWFLRCKKAGEQMDIRKPHIEEHILTNFIRI